MTTARTDKTRTRSYSMRDACPVCESGSKGCSVTKDGLHFCRGHKGDKFGWVFMGMAKGNTEYAQYRRADDPVIAERNREWEANHPKHGPHVNGQAHSKHASPKDWSAEAAKYTKNLTPELLTELAATLGVPEAALCAFRVGYLPDDYHGPCWTFPEVGANGQLLGIDRRYRDGGKRVMAGGGRGLTVPDGWRDRDGPVFLTEGASDTIALHALGLAAVGRPSNVAGVEQLVLLLKDVPAERGIVVVADVDPKPDGSWPGKQGADQTAARLAVELKRPVKIAFPPRMAKDVRQWVLDRQTNPTCADAWGVAGDDFLAEVQQKAQTIDPRETESRAAGYQFKAVDSATFAATDYRPEWLIRRLLVRNQAAVAGGPKKSLKTSLLVDLALSLGSGAPFLGEFVVERPVRVAMLSAESGGFTLQETAKRCCQAKGISLESADVLWGFELPQFSDLGHMTLLRNGLRDRKVEVAILDPLYLALLAGQGGAAVRAENLYEVGPLLLAATKACLDAGATPILAHHAKKHTGHDPLDLDALAYSGIAEFARQWLLVSRREPYDPGSGKHQLWLNVGGSVGHGGLWSVDVNEGMLGEDFGGRIWEVAVTTVGKALRDEFEAAKQARREEEAKKDSEDDDALAKALDKLGPDGKAAGYNQVQDEARLPKARMQRAVNRLKHAKVIEDAPAEAVIGSGATRTVKGLKRVQESTISPIVQTIFLAGEKW